MRKILIIIMLILNTPIYSEKGYRLPSENITQVFNTPSRPYLGLINFETFGFENTYQSKQTLEQLSEELIGLAGVQISKKLNAEMDYYPVLTMKIRDFESNSEKIIQFPENIKIRKYMVSFDKKKLAVLHETEKGIKLLIVDLKSAKITDFPDLLINDAMDDNPVQWMNDNKSLLIRSIPKYRGSIPNKNLIPSSPIIEQSDGKISQTRTYQNLLKDSYDEELFEYFFRSVPIILDIENGKYKPIGEPAIYNELSFSPDHNVLLVSKIVKPYSYQLPYYYFPQKFELWDQTGNLLKELADRPLQDEIPIGGTITGPRRYQWQPLKAASLIWVEALDEGNPKNTVDFRDQIKRWNYPFDKNPEIMFKTNHRFSRIRWSEVEDEYIYREYDRDKLWGKEWLSSKNSNEPQLILDLSIRDEYNDPGEIINKKTENGFNVFLKKDNCIYYKNNLGASPEGNYPYLAKYNLQTKEKEILFRCNKGHHEQFKAFYGKNLDKIIIGSQTTTTPQNYYLLDLKTKKRIQLTNNKNPYPEVTNLKKEIVEYTRKDSVPLSGILYLPENYDGQTKLPLVINAYPQEYTDNSTAGQITSSPNRFISFWGASVKYFALNGYAVLEDASIPIIGDPETVNETFITQLLDSVEGAITYLNIRGIIDTSRVGIIGHSYGAFMVANVLAHSDLCSSGIAKSGAYNRTLTPFGFQAERRTLWQAPEFYSQISPFMHADKIDEPILLIHGENDPNSGTYPMQSKRMYQALKGNGATAKLVILPKEGHSYRAKESNLHVLAEMFEWFDKYVKNK